MVLVDSSVWIETMRDDGDLLTRVGLEELLKHMEACICGLVKVEVLGGARPAERRDMMKAFSTIPYLASPEELWEVATKNNWKLRDRGVTAPASDIAIATLAIHRGLRVFARDKHFDAMAPVLGLKLYQPGIGGSYNPQQE